MSGAYICCGALKQLARTVVVALLSANLTSLGMMAKEKQGFGFHFVEDFSKYHPRKGLTPQKQESMAERRRGVYASEPGVLAGRIREQLGKDVRHLILDISTDNRVKLIFECTDGECVSTTYFMEGRMSDTSFLWGTLGEGVVARYGVLGDYLPVAFCPRRRPVTLVMKRRGEKMDSKSVRLVSTEISLAECREQDDDLFGLICENAIMARTIRTKVENGKCLLNDSEVVAYYVKTGSSIRYWVLQANGGFRKFEVTLENELRELPLLLFEWWDEFEGKHSQIGSILLHDVRRDEVTEISTVFGLSQSLDSRIVSPRYFNNHVPGKAQTLGERLDESVARELSKPNEMFIRSTYKRLDDTAENRGIRLKLDKALKKSNSASLANRNVVGK